MTKRQLPSLSALRTFEALARTMSFTQAAHELGVTQAAVSRQVKALEDQLSVTLVLRHPNGNALTDAGEVLFGSVYSSFEAIQHAVERIRSTGAREILTISVAPFFAAQWLTPRLMSFMNAYPDIEIRLQPSYHPVDHKREGVDIGVNWGSGAWPGVETQKIMDGTLVPVVSPKLLEAHGAQLHPEQLTGMQLFFEFDLTHWRMWFAKLGIEMGAGCRYMRMSDSHVLRRVAVDGHGVALLFSELLQEDLQSDQLRVPFQTGIHTGNDYYLNFSSSYRLPRKAQLFRRWLLDQI